MSEWQHAGQFSRTRVRRKLSEPRKTGHRGAASLCIQQITSVSDSVFARIGACGVARLVGIDGGVVSGVINLESFGVEAPDWRPRHDEHYHEA